ncbi:hypothetical protein M433DRAFT_71773 [Acidomyces richmondensis BFW]|nr:hypothetical protein M433DRAFT_71773 [Acidomyces richmondensis BFW]
MYGRTSTEIREHDHETLTAEEDAERLLVNQRRTGTVSSLFRKNSRDDLRLSDKSKGRNRRRRGGGVERRELMYEMEEGGPRSSSTESSGHSSEVDMGQLGVAQARQRQSKRSRLFKFAMIHVVIIIAFLAALYGAWLASNSKHHTRGTRYVPQQLSNGSHIFAPTTILISLDGFRADFLHRNLTPTLSEFVRSGVSPKYMFPSFPSLTFPNHFTLVTGLHPESHGIVGNTFWDPEMHEEFYYTDPARSMTPKWWNAEPVWVTAELAGVTTAIHMWPGSEAHIGGVEPTHVDKFNEFEPLTNKAKRILEWLDLPNNQEKEMNRPQFIAAYVPNIDFDGHLYGPNSTSIRSTIAEVDDMLGQIFHGIDERNLTNIVNIIIVSDHGMATISTKRLIQLEDLLDTNLIEHIDGWPLYGMRPKNSSEAHIKDLYSKLLEKSRMTKYKGQFEVFLRDQNMPERYHFTKNARIAPLWIVPKTGWAVVTKDEYNVAEGKAESWGLHGLHGYDNLHPLMRAIFVARGPAFPHVAGSLLEPFQNTEVYNIVCDSIGINPVPNNGSLRLPLNPQDKHNSNDPPEVPDDPQDSDDLVLPDKAQPHTTTHSPPVTPHVLNRPDFMLPTEGVPTVSPTSPAQSVGDASPPMPAEHDDITYGEKHEGINRWWDWVSGKIEVIKGWASTFWNKDSSKTGSA